MYYDIHTQETYLAMKRNELQHGWKNDWGNFRSDRIVLCLKLSDKWMCTFCQNSRKIYAFFYPVKHTSQSKSWVIAVLCCGSGRECKERESSFIIFHLNWEVKSRGTSPSHKEVWFLLLPSIHSPVPCNLTSVSSSLRKLLSLSCLENVF